MPPSHIGKYEVQRRLGSGGMGSLYLARDPGLDRLVAIKVLKEEYQDDPELRERFIREARSVARLRHENIIIVFDIGEADGLPFMAMEYIAGDTVAQLLRRTPTPPLLKRLTMVEEVCAGLMHAHGAGIIHRDIKPANLMITGDSVLKILDFGIARLADSGMTQGGMMLGTVNYMSPEQVAGPEVDHRTDIFATGAVLYELIALAQAFPGRIDTGVLNRILNEGPVPIEQLVPTIDADLAGIVRRALQRNPDDRYQRASDMGRDLARVRRRLAEQPWVADPSVTQNITVAERPRPSTGAAKKSDSAGQKILSPERFAELQRQQVEEHLRSGEAAFAQGDHDGALHYGERAAMVDPDSRGAIDLINRARFVIESKAIRRLLADAQRLLADGHLDDAAARSDQANVALRNIDDASGLKAEGQQLSEQIAAARDREQKISASLGHARSSIEQGGYETALRAVYQVLALDPDRAEARALEQTAIARLQAQREQERARRQAYDQISSARGLADAGRFDDALAAIAGVQGPSDTVRAAADAAAVEVRRQQRQAQIAAVLAEARRIFERGDFDQAIGAIDAIPVDDLTPDGRALRAQAEKARRERLELERRRAEVDGGLRSVSALIEQNDLAGAAARLEEVERIGVVDPRISELQQRVAGLVAAAQERRRQEARDRLAAKLVEAARQLLEKGDGYAAIALLERDESNHPLVGAALRDTRASVAEQEERARLEAERRRQEEDARKRAALEAARKAEDARLAEEQRKRDEERRAREAERLRRRQEYEELVRAAETALEAENLGEATVLLKRAERVSVDDSGLAERAAAARAEAERLEFARREEARREEERQRREEDERRRAEEARRRAEEAQRKEQAFLGALSRAKATADHESALDILRNAQAILPGDRRADTLVEERRTALAAQKAEAARQAEETRRQEEASREREAALTQILSRERREAPEAALTLLRDALTLAPGDQRVEARIAQRNIDVERERLEAERQRQIALAVSSIAAALDRKDLDAAERAIQEGEHQFGSSPFDGTRRTYITLRREEAAARKEAEDAEQARQVRERKAREKQEKEEAAQRRREERAALARERAASGAEPSSQWRRYAAAAAVVATLTGGGSWLVLRWSGEAGRTGGPASGGSTATDAPPPPISAPAPPPSADGSRTNGPLPPDPRVDSPTPGGLVGTGRGGRGQNADPRNDVAAAARDQAEREQASKDQAAKDQAAKEQAARDQAAREQAVKDQAVKDQLARDQLAREQAAREQAARDLAATKEQLAKERAAKEQLAREQASREAAFMQERTAIQEMLNQYVDAYDRLDERRLRQIVAGFTGIPARPLIKSVELRLSDVDITVAPDGQTAAVTMMQNFTYVWNRVGPPPTSSGRVTWRLRKNGGTWGVVP